jgi:hypothetical protein
VSRFLVALSKIIQHHGKNQQKLVVKKTLIALIVACFSRGANA